MIAAELIRALIVEIKKYEGFAVEIVRLGDYEAVQISRGDCVFDMLVHPMLEARYVDYTRVVIDCVAMYAARLEVAKNAV